MAKLFFPLMLVVLVVNIAMTITAKNWHAAIAYLGTLACLGGWYNMILQCNIQREMLGDTTAALHSLRKEIDRG